MSHHHSIADLVHDYADAVVCRDGDRWAATWDDDCVWDLGGGHEVVGRAAVYDLSTGAMGSFQTVIQTVLNGSYEIDGAAECVLNHLALDTACFVIEKRYSGLMLREHEIAQSAPALLEASPVAAAPRDETDTPGTSERADSEEGSDRAGRSSTHPAAAPSPRLTRSTG